MAAAQPSWLCAIATEISPGWWSFVSTRLTRLEGWAAATPGSHGQGIAKSGAIAALGTLRWGDVNPIFIKVPLLPCRRHSVVVDR